jgi:hypothetical protein
VSSIIDRLDYLIRHEAGVYNVPTIRDARAEIARLEAIVDGIDELVNDLDTGIVGANVDIDKDSSGCAVTVWGRWNDSSGSEYHAADWRDALMQAVAAKREAAEGEGGKL